MSAKLVSKALLNCGIACCTMLSHGALAQDARASTAEAAPNDTTTSEPIVVTGTSIRGVAPVGAPVLGINQDEIQLQPTTTTTDLLRQVPAVLTLGASESYAGEANNANANITRGNGINLRGLGTSATLTLLNGRRLPASGVQGEYFDPSVFSTSAIGRIEVMADGGSAIYGSDAVGGVVNILTRRNFNGAEAYVRQGFADNAQSTQAGAIIGKRWSSGGVTLSYEYQNKDALLASDRPRYTDDLTAFGGQDLRLTNAAPGNISIGGVFYPIPAGQDGTNLQPSALQPASTTNPLNRESRYKYATAIPGQVRHSVLGRVEQDISPDVKVWSEGFYSHRRLEESIGAVTTALTVPSTNAFYVAPAGVTPGLCAARVGAPAGTRCETINYSFSEDLGPVVRHAFSEVYQVAGGIDAKLGSNWGISAYVSQGQDIESREQYVVNSAQLALALLDSNRATAFNPFGDAGATNPATLDKIRGSQTVATRGQLTDFNAKIDGSLFSLPGGDLRIAVGGEYQKHHWRYHVLDSSRTPSPATSTETLSLSSRDVKSGYAEAFIPFVGSGNAMPGVQELSLSAAVRYDDYSDFGSTTNPKFAVNYVPVEGLTLRGTYGTSFRAPSLSQIDPANVVILAENFVDPTSPTGTTRTLFVRGSNTTDLGPEKATTWSLGFDVKPLAVPKLRMSFTYYNVNYKNRIESPGANRAALTAALEPLLGNLITRNPTAAQASFFMNMPGYGSPPEDPTNIKAIVDGRFVNVGSVKTDGLEGSIQYSTDVAGGTVSAGVIGAYILNYGRAIFPAEPIREVVNTYGNPARFRLRANLEYANDSFTAVAYANHTGGYTNDTVTPAADVPSYTTFDLGFRYRIKPGFLAINDVELSLDVQNLFDRDPPVVLTPTPLSYDGQVASLLGRNILVGLRTRW